MNGNKKKSGAQNRRLQKEKDILKDKLRQSMSSFLIPQKKTDEIIETNESASKCSSDISLINESLTLPSSSSTGNEEEDCIFNKNNEFSPFLDASASKYIYIVYSYTDCLSHCYT